MRWFLLLTTALCLIGCERHQSDGTEDVEQLDPAVAEQVVSNLLVRMKEHAKTSGARIANALPRLKDEAAQAAEFPNWERFLARVRKTEPGREVEISRQITAQLRELQKPEEESQGE